MENGFITAEPQALCGRLQGRPDPHPAAGRILHDGPPLDEQGRRAEPPGTKTASGNLKLGPKSGLNVNVISHAPGQEHQADPVLDFYAQCRVFADFLIQKSGKENVFRGIAQNEAKGGDMASWLMENGRPLGLPVSVDDLDRQFRAGQGTVAAAGSLRKSDSGAAGGSSAGAGSEGFSAAAGLRPGEAGLCPGGAGKISRPYL